MARVTGFGGMFFKAQDPAALAAWYARHLGLEVEDWGGVRFREDESRPGSIVWSPFPADTAHFGGGEQPFMVNFRVDDLHALLAQLRESGVPVDEHVEDGMFGRFGWITDPEGRRVELWQPPGAVP